MIRGQVNYDFWISDRKMSIRIQVVVFILKLINKIANFLEIFGIKLMKITRENVLKGKQCISITMCNISC